MSIHSPTVKSRFVEADENHLARLTNVAGVEQNDPRKMNAEDLRIVMELDYFLWQQNVPADIDRKLRYDRSAPDGDPLTKLFDNLPTPSENEIGKDDPWVQVKHDSVIVMAIWPYANSSLHYIHQRVADKHGVDIWWIARFAFALGDTQDYNNIKNYFMQGLASLYTTTPGLAGNPEDDTASSQAVLKKQQWISYCYWIATGRTDDTSPLDYRVGMKRELVIRTVLGSDACSRCGFRPSDYAVRCASLRYDPPRLAKPLATKLYHCGGCKNDMFPYLRRMYCSIDCQKRDWKTHRPFCQQQKHFLRGVYLLELLSIKFETSTFTGWATMITPVPDSVHSHMHGEGFVIAPAAYTDGPWTGSPVFPDEPSLLAVDETRAQDLRAWDGGHNIYIHLKRFIFDCLGPYCDCISELQVYVRNANGASILASDYDRASGTPILTKGRNPLFHPHPILYTRLRSSGAEFIIDLHPSIFGWSSVVLPLATFVRSRLVSVVQATELAGGEPLPFHWCPAQESPLREVRNVVLREVLADCRAYLAENTKCKTLYQATRLKEEKWKIARDGLMATMTQAFVRVRQRINSEMKYRQYLVYDANPYGPEFRLGITPGGMDQELFNELWLPKHVWQVVIARKATKNTQSNNNGAGDSPSQGNKDNATTNALPAPSHSKKLPECRRIVDLWLDRLVKKYVKASFDSLDDVDAFAVFGDQTSKMFNLGRSITTSDGRAAAESFARWQQTTSASLDMHFRPTGDVQGFGVAGATGNGDSGTIASRTGALRFVHVRRAMLRAEREEAARVREEMKTL